MQAQSDVDSTTVTDTSRQDPFDIDPEGGLDWGATSPGAIMDHTWEIHVEFAGFNVPIESGSHDNEGGSPGNAGQVEDLTAYIETVSVASGQLLRGTFIVGGFIAGTGACDGFGFVRLVSDSPFESLVSRFAGGLGLLALLILLMLFLRRGSGGSEPDEATAGTGPVGEPDAQDMERTADEGPGPPSAASFAGAARDEDEDDSLNLEPGADDPPKRDDLA